MCTVTYLPTKKGYLLTSNRDEAPKRNIMTIEKGVIKDKTVIYPKDPLSKGTWIATSTSGNTACLLNGAFSNFIPQANYRHSRGKTILDYFETGDFQQFSHSYPLHDLAPFTLVVVEKAALSALIWDGEQRYVDHLDASVPAIWSSATLYDKPIRDWRAHLFQQWILKQSTFERANIIDFHQFGTSGDQENGFVMNRNNAVKTLSISSVQVMGDDISFQYTDLLNQNIKTYELCTQNECADVQ